MDRVTGKPLAGADHLRQSIADILGTPLGTRIGRRDYGSELPELMDQPMNDLGRIRVFAATALAIMRQERRARISRIALAAGDTPGAFVIRIVGRRVDVAAPIAALDLSIPVRAMSALAARKDLP
jgi:phage baseplate assembly protein W